MLFKFGISIREAFFMVSTFIPFQNQKKKPWLSPPAPYPGAVGPPTHFGGQVSHGYSWLDFIGNLRLGILL
jgi:hypothetical protein